MADRKRVQKFIDELEYDVYHDESLVSGYWHGILLVPRSERQRLLTLMSDVRHATEYQHPVSLKNLKWESGSMYRCTRSWLQIGIAALIHNLKGERFGVFTGDDGRFPGYGFLDRIIGARLVILRVRDGLSSLRHYPDHASKVETTFRMGLKFGLKCFLQDGLNYKVASLHFDGHEQYGRRIDLRRIRERMGTLPSTISFPVDTAVDDRSSNHSRPECQSYDDCQLLQLSDVLVGGFRTALGHPTRVEHIPLCAPLEKLAADFRRGNARMKNSRWYRGYSVRECYLDGGTWKFTDIFPARRDSQRVLFPKQDPVAPQEGSMDDDVSQKER